MTKFLIIRFSSIGDIIQCMGIIGGIRERFADVEIHWITRKDMVGTLSMDGRIDKIWAFDKGTGLAGLLKMAADLRKEHFDYIYDAHSNIRSNILKLIVSPLPFVKPYVALRSKERGKRAAFAEIVRSGHSKQNQHAVFVHSTVVRKHLFVSRRRDCHCV